MRCSTGFPLHAGSAKRLSRLPGATCEVPMATLPSSRAVLAVRRVVSTGREASLAASLRPARPGSSRRTGPTAASVSITSRGEPSAPDLTGRSCVAVMCFLPCGDPALTVRVSLVHSVGDRSTSSERWATWATRATHASRCGDGRTTPSSVRWAAGSRRPCRPRPSPTSPAASCGPGRRWVVWSSGRRVTPCTGSTCRRRATWPVCASRWPGWTAASAGSSSP